MDHGLCKDCRCRRAIARDIIRLGSNFLDELSAHIFKAILELNLLGNCNTIICDGRSAIGLLENDISALRAKCYTNNICELIDALCKSLSCLNAVLDFLCHNELSSRIKE